MCWGCINGKDEGKKKKKKRRVCAHRRIDGDIVLPFVGIGCMKK